MLFSKMSFRQLFVSRPGRRRCAHLVAAEIQTLQTKILPSAVPIETEEATYESTDDYMSEYADDYMTESTDEYVDDYMPESTDEYMYETEESTTEAMSDSTPADNTTADSTMPGSDGPDAWFNYIQTSTSGGVITMSGMVSSSTGDYSNLSLSFEGSFTGVTATIASDGSFSASVPVGSTGLTGYVALMQTENGEESQIDLQAVFV